MFSERTIFEGLSHSLGFEYTSSAYTEITSPLLLDTSITGAKKGNNYRTSKYKAEMHEVLKPLLRDWWAFIQEQNILLEDGSFNSPFKERLDEALEYSKETQDFDPILAGISESYNLIISNLTREYFRSDRIPDLHEKYFSFLLTYNARDRINSNPMNQLTIGPKSIMNRVLATTRLVPLLYPTYALKSVDENSWREIVKQSVYFPTIRDANRHIWFGSYIDRYDSDYKRNGSTKFGTLPIAEHPYFNIGERKGKLCISPDQDRIVKLLASLETYLDFQPLSTQPHTFHGCPALKARTQRRSTVFRDLLDFSLKTVDRYVISHRNDWRLKEGLRVVDHFSPSYIY